MIFTLTGAIILITIIVVISRNKKENILKKDRVDKLSNEIYQREQEKKKEFSLEGIKEKIELVRQVDDFENTEWIQFKNISQDGYDYLPMYFEMLTEGFVSHVHIGLSFSIFQRTACILDVYSYGINEMGLAKGDELKLIFDNGDKINIKFDMLRSNNSVMKSNSYFLNEEELRIFSTERLAKWKLTSIRRGVFVVGDNTIFHERCKIKSKLISQEVLKYLASTIRKTYSKEDILI